MRSFRLLLAALLLLPGVGCAWMREKGWVDRPRGGGPIEPVAAEQLVRHLNDRAADLRSVEYDAAARVSGKGIPIPVTLDGDLAAVQPKSFRMVAKGKMAGKVDLGSNDQQFWVYVEVPREEPYYRYASHADFQAGRAPLPGGIPFDPDWVMQALGMTALDPAAAYVQVPFRSPGATPRPSGRPQPPADPSDTRQTVPIDTRERTYTLRWSAASPAGRRVVKEVVFDADQATGNRPQVRRHLMKDEATGKVIASAEVVAVGTAAGPPGRPDIRYPTRVQLKWPEQDFNMDLDLRAAQVNQLGPEQVASRQLFDRPDRLYTQTSPINLANYQPFNPQPGR